MKSVVSPFEFDVMILVRLGFKPSEIAVLTDSSLPNVSNARKMHVGLIVLHLQRTKLFMLMKNKTTIFYLAFIVFISFYASININAICYRKYVDTCKDNDISINVVLVPIDIKNGSTGNGNHKSPFRNPNVSIIRNQLLLYGRWGRCTLQLQTKNKEF